MDSIYVASQLIGGLFFFLVGIKVLGYSLNRLTGSKLKPLLSLFTNNRFYAGATGVIITTIMSSNVATTMLLVSLSDAGLITLVQAAGITLGQGLGTAVTVQIIAFNIGKYSLFILFAGLMLRILTKYERGENIGNFLIGIGAIFYAMTLMRAGFAGIPHDNIGVVIDTIFRTPLLSLIFCTILTIVFHSSTIVIAGFAMAMASSGLISFVESIPIILGANAGSALVAMFYSLRSGYRGKRVALIQLLVRLIGVIVFFIFYQPLGLFVQDLSLSAGMADANRMVANFHTFFNLALFAGFVPFVDVLVMAAKKIVKKSDPMKAEPIQYLDVKDLNTPDVALANAHREIMRMAEQVSRMYWMLGEYLETDKVQLLDKLVQADDTVDTFDEILTAYLTQIRTDEMESEKKRLRFQFFTVLRNLEAIGDILSKDVTTLLKKKTRGGLSFSVEGETQLRNFYVKIRKSFVVMIDFLSGDAEAPVEDIFIYENHLPDEKQRLYAFHFSRIEKNIPDALECSSIYMDLLMQFRFIHFYITDTVLTLRRQ